MSGTASDERMKALDVASVANLKSARLLALDDDLAVRHSQFDLADVTASIADLLRNQRRAFVTTVRSELRNVFAAVDANGRGGGTEVGSQHAWASIGASVANC